MPTENLVANTNNVDTESCPRKYESVAKCERTERFDSVDLNDDETEEIRGV